MYDLIVIGGGPGGYMAAERAAEAGLSVLLIEKNKLGGVCLNEGCIPSKTLLNSAKIYSNAKNGKAYGVDVDNIAIDHKKVIKRKNKVVSTLTQGVNAVLKQKKVQVLYGKAEIVNRNSVKVKNEVFETKWLIIATGSLSILPDIPGVKAGIKSGKVLTSSEIFDLEDAPKKLVVIGGGVIGLEMASYFNTLGCKVTVIEMLPNIAGAIDKEISGILLRNLKKKGIEFLLGSRVTAVNENYVEYDGGKITADKVLLAIGRKPDVQGFGLENTEVLIENGAIVIDKYCQTSVSNIYAVGDVTGKFMLAHVAYRQAEVAVNNILGNHDIMRYYAVPAIIYTSPEVAVVGETEETVKIKGLDIQTVTVPMVYSGRYVAECEETDGICKVIIDSKNRNIIGVHMIGSYVSEIIVSACTMVEMQMRVEDVKELIFPHPTVSEIIRESVFKF